MSEPRRIPGDFGMVVCEENEATYAHIRAIIAGIEAGGVTLEGVAASLRGLLPETTIPTRLRDLGHDHLAEHLEWLLSAHTEEEG